MNGFISYVTSDKIIKWGVFLSACLVGLMLAFLGFFYRLLPPYVPVYNQMPWGIERLGGRLELFLPILLALGVLILNVILSRLWYEKLPLLSRMLSVTTFLINLLTFIFIVRIILLII
jgi:hypothetical protein